MHHRNKLGVVFQWIQGHYTECTESQTKYQKSKIIGTPLCHHENGARIGIIHNEQYFEHNYIFLLYFRELNRLPSVTVKEEREA